MEKAVNALAVLGNTSIFLNLLHFIPNDILLYVGFLCWAVMNVINAKLHAARHETKKVIVIAICAIVLFVCSGAGFMKLFGAAI